MVRKFFPRRAPDGTLTYAEVHTEDRVSWEAVLLETAQSSRTGGFELLALRVGLLLRNPLAFRSNLCWFLRTTLDSSVLLQALLDIYPDRAWDVYQSFLIFSHRKRECLVCPLHLVL